MQCKKCAHSKLSQEFPKQRLSPRCKHRPNWCTRCLLSTGQQACPECDAPIGDDLFVKLCSQLVLTTQFDHFKPPEPPSSTSSLGYSRSIMCTVSMMGGESVSLVVETGLSVHTFKQQLEARFRVPIGFQRLMCAGQEIKPYLRERQASLRDYGVTEGSTLQLMRLLLSVTHETPYNNINFVLHWQRSYGRRVFLDASCFVFRGNANYNIVDFKNTYAVTGVTHSGPANNRTSHVITVSLNNLHHSVTHLFFVMSACHVATLAEFAAPTVSLYDTARRDEQISNYSIAARGDSQAVIMCCMKRTLQGGWDAFTLGEQSAGYCYEYAPIIAKIRRIFASGALA